MDTRQTTRPRRLHGPAPSVDTLQRWLACAASAPDHGRCQPWRFIMVPAAQRPALGAVFAQALVERDPAATTEQIDMARDKALRAPVLLLLVVDGQRGDPAVDLNERILSAGCAVQNLLLMATAQGFGSGLTSGKALRSSGLRKLFALWPTDHALCFISLGHTNVSTVPPQRPHTDDYTSTLTADGIVVGIHPELAVTP